MALDNQLKGQLLRPGAVSRTFALKPNSDNTTFAGSIAIRGRFVGIVTLESSTDMINWAAITTFSVVTASYTFTGSYNEKVGYRLRVSSTTLTGNINYIVYDDNAYDYQLPDFFKRRGTSAPIPPANYVMNFAGNSYTTPAGSIADPVASGLLTVARSTPAYAINNDGTYSSFAANAARITTKGLLVERAGFNYLNNSNAGAVVSGLASNAVLAANSGTLPRNWVATAVSGVFYQVIDIGTDPVTNLPRTRMRFYGTPASTSTYSLRFSAIGNNTGAPPATIGELTIGSIFYGFPNTVAGPTSSQLALYYLAGNVGTSGIIGTNTFISGLSSATSPCTATMSLSQSTAVRIETLPYLAHLTVDNKDIRYEFGTSSGVLVDFMIDLIMPQMETISDVNMRATTPILGLAQQTTVNGAVTASTTVVVTSSANMQIGHVFSGTGVTFGTVITNIVGNTLTISKVATISNGVTVTATGANRAQDVINLSGALLTYAQSAAVEANCQLAAMPYRASFLSARAPTLTGVEKRRLPILGLNAGTKLLSRETDGSLATATGAATQTFKCFLGNWNLPNRIATVTWSGSKVGLSCTASGNYMENPVAATAVTSIQIGSDGGTATLDNYLSQLTVTSSYSTTLSAVTSFSAQVVCYGAKPGGIIAAYRAIKEGKTAIIIGDWRDHILGGMMSGGLGFTDVVTASAYGGLCRWLFTRANVKMGKSDAGTGTTSYQNSPRAFQATFEDMVTELNIPVIWTGGVSAVNFNSGTKRIVSFSTALRTVASKVCSAKMVSGSYYVGADYEGDFMPLVGISYYVGRESNAAYNELRNGFDAIGSSGNGGSGAFQLSMQNGTNVAVDPYVTPATPASGIIVGGTAYPSSLPAHGDAIPDILQAYNFRCTMTFDANRRVPIFAAGGATDPSTFGWSAAWAEMYIRYIQAIAAAATSQGRTFTGGDTGSSTAGQWGMGDFFQAKAGLGEISNIYDCNNAGGFSHDYLRGNDGYIPANNTTRETIWQDHIKQILRIWWTLQYAVDARIPAAVQTEALNWGWDIWNHVENLPTDPPNFASHLYVREGRRLINTDFPTLGGNTYPVYNENDVCLADGTTPRDPRSIGNMSYGLDSHQMTRYVNGTGTATTFWLEGAINLFAGAANGGKGTIFGTDKMGPLPFAAVVPKQSECTNYITTFHVAASHPAFGAFRMEPSSMTIGEAAGLMASLAIEQGSVDIQSISGSWTDGATPGTPRYRLLNTATGAIVTPVVPLTN